MVFSHGNPAVLASLGKAADVRISRSIDWWNSWASNSRYNGPYRDEVTRSALTLKLLTYAPSGAIVAAPTTSLPEKIGECATGTIGSAGFATHRLTVRALLDLGFNIEAEASLAGYCMRRGLRGRHYKLFTTSMAKLICPNVNCGTWRLIENQRRYVSVTMRPNSYSWILMERSSTRRSNTLLVVAIWTGLPAGCSSGWETRYVVDGVIRTKESGSRGRAASITLIHLRCVGWHWID